MTTPKPNKQSTKAELLKLIEKAKDAETCRDMDSVREILRPMWADIHETPDFSEFEQPIKAELLRITGFFLAFDGNSKGKKDCQERGKDLLTNAIAIFEELDCPHKLTEARIFLALCYWYEGAVEESELILNDAEQQYEGNKHHDVYIQICYYRMVILSTKQEYRAAAEIIEKMKPLIELCENTRILAMFHTEAGVNCRRQKKYEEATNHYLKAIGYSLRLNIGGLIAANLNNLAYLKKETGDFEKAHEYIDEAIAINKKLNQTGFLAHKYDTKALIYFDVREYENALSTINIAIELSKEGEDYAGLSDALFDKSKILLRLGRLEKALNLFSELMETARLRLGEAAAKRYAAEFSKLVYPKRGVSYREEVRLFQKDLVRNALLESDNIAEKTKDMLSISQGFIRIVKQTVSGIV